MRVKEIRIRDTQVGWFCEVWGMDTTDEQFTDIEQHCVGHARTRWLAIYRCAKLVAAVMWRSIGVKKRRAAKGWV